MSKFASFDADGLPLMFYDLEVHGDTIPADAVKITDAQWMAFLNNQGRRRWLDGKVVPYAPPAVEPETPQVVSKAQAKLALLEAKLLDGVETALAALEGEDGQRARIEWNDRTEFHRDHEFIALLAAAIGLTDGQVDALFERAAQL